MEAATLQKKEENKNSQSVPPITKDDNLDMQQDVNMEAGVPLFLQQYDSLSLASPPPIQRLPEEEDTEQLLQTKPIAPLVQREVVEEEEEDIAQIGLDSSPIQRQIDDEEEELGDIPVFPKLTIGAPNDKYEQEADQVAETVMRMPEPGVQRKPT